VDLVVGCAAGLVVVWAEVLAVFGGRVSDLDGDSLADVARASVVRAFVRAARFIGEGEDGDASSVAVSLA